MFPQPAAQAATSVVMMSPLPTTSGQPITVPLEEYKTVTPAETTIWNAWNEVKAQNAIYYNTINQLQESINQLKKEVQNLKNRNAQGNLIKMKLWSTIQTRKN